jgi:hypothetical protein
MDPSKVGSQGVRNACCKVQRFPPAIGPVTAPPTIVRAYGSSGSRGTSPTAPVRNAASAESHVNGVRSAEPIEPNPGPWNVASPAS